MFCPACGAECDGSARFCKACGKPLTSDQPPEAPAVPTAPGRSSATLAVLVTVSLALVAVVIAGALLWPRDRSTSPEAPAVGAPPRPVVTASGDDPKLKEGVEPLSTVEPHEETEPGAAPAPEAADEPVAEAQAVLENYLAADLGHDGATMAKYLGGQAAARFNPDVQGQEDLTVHSKIVSGSTVRDRNTVEFTVRVEWSPSDSYEVQRDEQTYVVKRTEEGWRVTNTPEYPE